MGRQSKFRKGDELGGLPVGKSRDGQIGNAMNLNIAAMKKADLFDSLSEDDKKRLIIKKRGKDGKEIVIDGKSVFVDRRGKPLYLSVEDIQLIKAISSCIPFYSQEIKEYISHINTMDATGQVDDLIEEKDAKTGESRSYIQTYDKEGKVVKKDFSPIRISISIPQISKDIIGDTREASLRKISERMQHLSEIEQGQIFYIKGDGKTEKLILVRPLIKLEDKVFKAYSEIRSTRGKKKDNTKDKTEDEPFLIGAVIELTSLFLFKALNEYCPIYKQRLFCTWRKNKTEMFAILLSDLESKWRQYYVAAIKAEAAAKEEYKELKKANKNEYYSKVATAKKAARIYEADTITIRKRLTTDYESTRQQRNRFIPDLQKAMASLIEYGIITEESRITKDKSKALFFYNPDFVAEGIEQLLQITEN